MLRVCVVGLGHIGNLHSSIYSKCDFTELVAVCDRVEQRAAATSKRLGVPYYLDAAEMMDAVKPDLVSVATGGFEYASDHYEPTMQALERDIPVLCEKPIHNEIPKAEEMVALAKKKNICFGIDFNHRFTPVAFQAKKWLDQGRVGEQIFANMALWIGRQGTFDTPFYHMKALNPHSVEMLEFYCGPIQKVQCFGHKSTGREIWSTASFNFQFKSGIVGHLTSSYDITRAHPMERCEIAGLNGRIVVEDMWREATLYPAETMVKEVITNPVFGGYKDFDDTFECRLLSFAKQVMDGAKPQDINGSGQAGLSAQRVIQAGIDSLLSGEIITLDV